MLTQRQVEIIRQAVSQRKNIIISGGTNTGKTTFANAILKEFACIDRVIILEDTRELDTSFINDCVSMRTINGTVTMDDLLRTALRLRPDRILVGEVRGKEAWSLLKVFSSGHSGGLCTIHADGGKSTLIRLEHLVLEAGLREIPRELIGSAIDLDIHLKYDKNTGNRLVDSIFRINDYDGKEYIIDKIG